MFVASPSAVSANAVAVSLSSHASPQRARAADIVAPALPRDIEFLRHRLPAGILHAARRKAAHLHVAAHRALIVSRAISEDEYYRALAAHLHVEFDAGASRGTLEHGGATAARAGILPLPGGAILFAPDGAGVNALLEMNARGALPTRRMALTSPRRFARLLSQDAEAIRDDASLRLPRRDADFSAATRLRLGSKFVLGAMIFAAVLACWLLPFAALALGQMVWAAGNLCVFLRLLAAITSMQRGELRARIPDDAELPVYTIIAPLYREANGALKLVTALERLAYPREKLDIKIVVEHSDGETRLAFEALRLPPWYEILVAPEGAPRTKPRAMNIALPFARGSLVTIYDAEDEPERGQLLLAAGRFARAPADVACLQARLAIDNASDSLISSLFAIEYAALFDVVNPGMADLGLPMPLGGTSNHFRRGALDHVCGWDAWNVTEDADLGIRLARFGYKVETLASTTHEEAPAHLRAWLAQRSRWQKGWMQTLATLLRNPQRLARDLGPWRALVTILMLAGGVLGPMIGPAAVVMLAWDASEGAFLHPVTALDMAQSTLWCTSALFCLASLYVPAALAIARRGLWREAWLAPLLPLYYVVMSIASWRALIEWMRNPYHWAKTSHGLARTSRRRDRARPAAGGPVRGLKSGVGDAPGG